MTLTSAEKAMHSDHPDHPELDGIHIVDCDAHFTEPADLWTARAPATWADRVPVQRTVDGKTGWYLNGEMWASTGGNTIRRGGEKILGEHVVHPFDDVDPAAWSVKERLELMDRMGIWSQVVYPNGVGFSSNHVFAIPDIDQRTAVLQIYNDFYGDIQEESGDRLLPQAMLPIWDMDLTVKEMERMLDRGIRGFTLSDKPELLGLAELPHDYFAPMWDLFNESGAAVNFHIGAGSRKEDVEAVRAARYAEHQDEDPGGPRADPPASADPYWRSFGHQRRLAVHATQMYMSNVRIVANLCMSDMFDRYPNLSIVSAESGIGWVPFILESLEFQLDQMVTDPAETSLQKRRPTDYFRDHIYVMFWFERLGPSKLIESVGVDNVLVETDVPHPTCLYPGTLDHFADVLGHLDPDIRRKVLQDNAARIYGLTVPTT
ncbi:MAG: amidohydrolase family protein [Xanthomonadales bacterium]|nr:amidohydrolase family protein [Xanthomonadales bacterium]